MIAIGSGRIGGERAVQQFLGDGDSEPYGIVFPPGDPACLLAHELFRELSHRGQNRFKLLCKSFRCKTIDAFGDMRFSSLDAVLIPGLSPGVERFATQTIRLVLRTRQQLLRLFLNDGELLVTRHFEVFVVERDRRADTLCGACLDHARRVVLKRNRGGGHSENPRTRS